MAFSHPFLFVLFLTFFSQANAQFQADLAVKSQYQQIFSDESVTVSALSQQAYQSEATKGSYLYLSGLKSAMNYFIDANYDGVLDTIQSNIKQIKELKPNTPFGFFCLGEAYLHLGLVQMAQGNKLSALLALKKAYTTHLKNTTKYPTFLYSQKTLGMLEVAFNEAEYYSDFSSLLTGVKATKEKGAQRLNNVIESSNLYSFEARLFQVILYQFVTYDKELATKKMFGLLADYPQSKLVKAISAIVFTKNNESERALIVLNKLNHVNPYFIYLEGVNHLQLLHHQKATASFTRFLKTNPSYYQVSAKYLQAESFYLTGNQRLQGAVKGAMNAPHSDLPADKSAKNKINSLLTKNKKLMKARLLFDGGNNGKALLVLKGIDKTVLGRKETIEYYYRLGRVNQSLGAVANAKSNFLLAVLKEYEETKVYYAPYSCLQLGKIYQAEGDKKKAMAYLEAGLKYNHYQYETAIKVKIKKQLER